MVGDRWSRGSETFHHWEPTFGLSFFVGGETFAVSFREGGSDTSTSSGMEVSINVAMAVLSQAGRWAKALSLCSFEAFVKRVEDEAA